MIRYTVSLDRRREHLVDIRLDIDGVQGEHLDLAMPAWIPGSYKIRDFARHVQDFDAGRLPWKKLDKQTWRVETRGRDSIQIRYAVYGFELSVRSSHIDSDHAYLNGPSVFLYVEGRRAEPHAVKFATRQDVATGLPKNFVAASYDHLVDCPIEIGNFDRRRFAVLGKPHEFVTHGPGNYDLKRVVGDAAKIVKQGASIFGGLPYDRYVFLLHTAPPSAGGGGLEHSNSCSLQTGPLVFRPQESYERFLNLVAHEFFHLWNVKRIIPKNVWPFRYETEAYTELLWVMEGVTSYYSPILLVRAGLLPAKSYFKYLATKVKAYRDKPGRLVESLAESSFNSWIHLYQPTEHSVNSQISYYEKGELVGLLLDLELRRKGATLDAVMKRLYNDFAKKDVGVGESDVQAVVEDLGGASFRAFFRDYVHGLKELPFESIFRAAGLELSKKPEEKKGPKPYLGIQMQKQAEKIVVTHVLQGTPAARAGLSASDEIVAIDGIKASPEVWDKAVVERKPGDAVTFTLFRGHVLRALEVTLGRQDGLDLVLAPAKKLSPAQKKRLVAWLGQPLKKMT